MWARARVRHLINAEIGNVSSGTRNEITDIGLKYQIVTDYTSFIAVERDIPENISGSLITQDVLTAIPKEWSICLMEKARPQASISCQKTILLFNRLEIGIFSNRLPIRLSLQAGRLQEPIRVPAAVQAEEDQLVS